MTEIDDAAEAALRVHARHPELTVELLAAAADGALEIATPADELDAAIERIAREFASGRARPP